MLAEHVYMRPKVVTTKFTHKYKYEVCICKKACTQQEWKSHGNHILRKQWKLGCASVAWDM